MIYVYFLLTQITYNWFALQLFNHWFHPPLFAHRGRMTYICTNQPGHCCFRQWLVACLVPCHFLNQCWLIVNCTKKLLNKMQQFPHKKMSFIYRVQIVSHFAWSWCVSLFSDILISESKHLKLGWNYCCRKRVWLVFTLGCHWHRRVLSSFHASVWPTWTKLLLEIFKKFSYRSENWCSDVEYGADRYWKW